MPRFLLTEKMNWQTIRSAVTLRDGSWAKPWETTPPNACPEPFPGRITNLRWLKPNAKTPLMRWRNIHVSPFFGPAFCFGQTSGVPSRSIQSKPENGSEI